MGAATRAVVAPSHQPVMPILPGAGFGDCGITVKGELGMKRSLFGTVAIAAVALSVVLIGAASAAKPPPAPTNNTCPTNVARNLPTSNIVGASASSSGATSTYTFESFTNPAQTSQGTPGLVNYCVYTTANPGPTAVTVRRVSQGRTGVPGRHPSRARTSGSPAQAERRPTSSSTGRRSRWAPRRGRVALLSGCADARPPHQQRRRVRTPRHRQCHLLRPSGGQAGAGL